MHTYVEEEEMHWLVCAMKIRGISDTEEHGQVEKK